MFYLGKRLLQKVQNAFKGQRVAYANDVYSIECGSKYDPDAYGCTECAYTCRGTCESGSDNCYTK